MYSIAVLLSAYNGTKYIKEQINSILEQNDCDITLIIRNDGSTDETIKILDEYKDNKKIIIYDEPNIGLAKSFMRLISLAKLDYDYYCFADQDDVWLKDKLISGIKMIENKNKPTLYSSNQTLVDQDLNLISIRYDKAPNIDYKQIISNNLISGCTFIWNKELQKLLTDINRLPSDELLDKRIHDVFVASVASVCGEVIFDMNSYILYRQHSSNVVGVRKNSRIKSFIKKFRDPKLRCGRSRLAYELFNKFNDVINDDEIRNELDILGNYKINKKYKKILIKNLDYRLYNNESKFEYKFKIRHKYF